MDIEEKANELRVYAGRTIPVDLYEITRRLKIYMRFEPTISSFLIIDEYPYIFINTQKHAYQQRYEWAHELGHFALHVGNQLSMPDIWTIKQETEANHFAEYLLIPTEELEGLFRVETLRGQIIGEISDRFEVPLTLASARLKRFEQHVLFN